MIPGVIKQSLIIAKTVILSKNDKIVYVDVPNDYALGSELS